MRERSREELGRVEEWGDDFNARTSSSNMLPE